MDRSCAVIGCTPSLSLKRDHYKAAGALESECALLAFPLKKDLYKAAGALESECALLGPFTRRSKLQQAPTEDRAEWGTHYPRKGGLSDPHHIPSNLVRGCLFCIFSSYPGLQGVRRSATCRRAPLALPPAPPPPTTPQLSSPVVRPERNEREGEGEGESQGVTRKTGDTKDAVVHPGAPCCA